MSFRPGSSRHSYFSGCSSSYIKAELYTASAFGGCCASTTAGTALSTGSRGIAWLRRLAISLPAGDHRGASGRDQIPLPSHIWVVVRDFQGQIYIPVRVFKSWGPCKLLVKKNNGLGNSIFVGFASEREGKKAVAAAGLVWPTVIEK